jgi:lysophospholipase L1-like esterase
MKADPYRIYRHPSSSKAIYGDVIVTYNENGLRDGPILPKAEGEFRILALGDSITFGWGVPQDQIFTVRLEHLLQGRLGRTVRVINSGVGGYNTVQELRYFKQEGITFKPDLVILTYLENDVQETPLYLETNAANAHSLLEKMMTRLRRLWLYRFVYHAYTYGLQYPPTANTEPLSLHKQGWSDSMSAIDELLSLCREHNIKLLIFYFRHKSEGETPLLQDVVLHANGVPVKDVGQWFEGLDLSTLTVSKVDSHPNSEGHRLMAEHMAADIETYLATPQ